MKAMFLLCGTYLLLNNLMKILVCKIIKHQTIG
jgi:hypothetical protein